MRLAKWIIGSCLAASGGLMVLDRFHILEIRRLTGQVSKLEQEKRELRDYVRRLSVSRRVAQVDVVDQHRDPLGQTITSLRWQEIAPEGIMGVPQNLVVVGNLVYFEAAVIKFDTAKVGEGDQDKGASLAMFRRVFGDRQNPAAVPDLDDAAHFAAGAPRSPFEENLWKLFWRLIDDPQLAKTYDVRVAQIEAPAVPLSPGQTWEVTLDAAGGLNLRKIGERGPTTRSTNDVAAAGNLDK